MTMAAGEAEAAFTIRPLVNPHHHFIPPARLDDVLIRTLGIDIRTLAHFIPGLRNQDGREAARVAPRDAIRGSVGVQFGAPADVEIPFIEHRKWLESTRDRMIWEALELRRAHRVHRIKVLVISADPILHGLTGITLWHFDSVMRTADTNAFLCQFI